MIDPNIGDGGYLDYIEPDWDAVLAQVNCIQGSGPTSDNLRAAAHYFQIHDDAREGTVGAGAMPVFFGSQNSLLVGMSTIPVPIELGNCLANYANSKLQKIALKLLKKLSSASEVDFYLLV